VPFVPQRMAFEAAPGDEVVATVNGVRISRQALLHAVGARSAAPVVRSENERRRIYESLVDLVEPLLWQQELTRLGRPLCPSRSDQGVGALWPVTEAVLAPHYYPFSERDLAAAHAKAVARSPERAFLVLEKGTQQALSVRVEELRRFSQVQLEDLRGWRSDAWLHTQYVLNKIHRTALLSAPSGLFGPIAFDDDEEHSALLFLDDLFKEPAVTIDDFRTAANAATVLDLRPPTDDVEVPTSEPGDDCCADSTDEEASTASPPRADAGANADDWQDPLQRAFYALASIRTERFLKLLDAEYARLVDQAKITFDDGSGTTWKQLRVAGTKPGPVAVVDGVEIRVDLERAVDVYWGRKRVEFFHQAHTRSDKTEREPEPQPSDKARVLVELIDRQLIAAKADAAGVVVTPDELAVAWMDDETVYPRNYSQRVVLAQTRADLRPALARAILLDKLAARAFAAEAPTEADAHHYYEEHVKEYTLPEQIQASVAQFKLKDSSEKKRHQALPIEAQESLKKLEARRGPQSYVRGSLPKAIEDVAFAAQTGTTVVVETERLYALVHVHTHTPEYRFPYDEVKASILRTLTARHKARARARVLAELRRGANVEVLEPGIIPGHVCRLQAECPGYRFGGAAAAAASAH
jgi:hypothetical protein